MGQVDYEAVLEDLVAKRTAIDAAIEGIMQVAGISLPEGTAMPQTAPMIAENGQQAEKLRDDSFFGMSIGDAVVKFLSVKKKPQAFKDIVKALEAGGLVHQSANFPPTVHSALTRRKADFIKIKRGQWGLAKWYPGRKKAEDAG